MEKIQSSSASQTAGQILPTRCLLPTRPGKPGLERPRLYRQGCLFRLRKNTESSHSSVCPWSLTKVLNKQIHEPRTGKDKHERSGFGPSTASNPVAVSPQGGFLTLSSLVVQIPSLWIHPVVTFLCNHETESCVKLKN